MKYTNYPVHDRNCRYDLLHDRHYKSHLFIDNIEKTIHFPDKTYFKIFTGKITKVNGNFVLMLMASLLSPNLFVHKQYALSTELTANVNIICTFPKSNESNTGELFMQTDKFVSIFHCPIPKIYNDFNLNQLNNVIVNIENKNKRQQIFSHQVNLKIEHEQPVAKINLIACATPIYEYKIENLLVWIYSNIKIVNKFILYVREYIYDTLEKQLHILIEKKKITLVRIPNIPKTNFNSNDRTEAYDFNDIMLHNEYHDQVLWLNHCHFRYGHLSTLMTNIDIDEIYKIQNNHIMKFIKTSLFSDYSIETKAFTNIHDCIHKNTSQPFTSYFLHSQKYPIQKGWPRRKHIFKPRLTNFNWIHGLFSNRDSCKASKLISHSDIYIKHYVDLNLNTNIHQNKCRCNDISKSNPCNYVNIREPNIMNKINLNQKYFVSYTEIDGISNQILALTHACWFAAYHDRYLILPETFNNHMQSWIADTYELKICNVIDCEFLQKHCKIIRQSDFSFSGGHILPHKFVNANELNFDYLNKIEENVIHFENKAMFNLGLSKKTFKIVDTFRSYPNPVKINETYIRMADEFIFDKSYNALQVRVIGANDYELGSIQNTNSNQNYISQTNPKLDDILKLSTKIPIFIMSQKCSDLYVTKILRLSEFTVICSTELSRDLHMYENLIVSQIICAKSDKYLGLELSTISQIVYRWRNQLPDWLGKKDKDWNIECNNFWCKQKVN